MSSLGSPCVCLCAEVDDVEDMIITHMTKLNENVHTKNAWKHVIIEANMSYISADQIAIWCRAFPKVIIEHADTTNRHRCGIWTGSYEKEAYAYTLREHIKKLNVCISSHAIGDNLKRDRAALVAQLRVFRLERRSPVDPAFGKYLYAFTGKTAGGAKDDLILSLQMSMYWGTRVRSTHAFQLWAKDQGIRL